MNLPKFNEKNKVVSSRSLLNSTWNKHKEIHIQTHHSQKVESQKQKENCESNKRKMTAKDFRLPRVKTNRPFRYDLNQIPYDYTVEVRNGFKGLDLSA